MPSQLALFDRDETSARNASLFDAWLVARQGGPRPLRASSIAVYRDMWATVCRALGTRHVDALRLSAGDLDAALHAVGGCPRYRKRLLSLLDAVLAAHGVPPERSAARELLRTDEYRLADTREQERLPTILNAFQQQALLAKLSARMKEGHWKAQRDAAVAAVIFGGGVKPGEAIELRWSQVVCADLDAVGGLRPFKLALDGRATTGGREAPLAPWAARVLADWMLTYRAMGLQGDAVFPGTRSGGRPVGKHAFYRAFRALLESLDIRVGSFGSHVLRHTFAVRQLAARKDDARRVVEVRDWMGLVRIESMQPYRRIVDERVVIV